MKCAIWATIGLLICGRALSMDPDLRLGQFNHKAWTIADGAPPNLNSMVQTNDGTLWLGSFNGLFRFDGIRFTPFTIPGPRPLESNDIFTLTAAPGGGLWIGSRWNGIALLKNGRMESYGEREGIPRGTVERILIDDHGTVWVAGIWGLARQQGSHFERVVFDTSDPRAPAWSVLQDRAGTLWVFGQNSVVARPAGASNFREIVKRTYNGFANGSALAEAPDGSVWAVLVDDRGLLRLDPPTNPQPTGNRLIPVDATAPILFDRDGNLWFDSKTGTGRITSSSLRENLPEQQLADRVAHFGNLQELGLTGTANDFLEDREGNLWVATDGGIGRLSPSNVVKMPFPFQDESAIAVGNAGTVIATAKINDTTSRVLEIRGDTVVRDSTGPLITDSFRDADGTIWLNGPAGISKYANGRFDTTPVPAQSGYVRISAMTRDGNGALWVSIFNSSGGHLYRFAKGAWQDAHALLPALPDTPVITAACDNRGRLWLSYGRRLAIVNGSDVRLLEASGLGLGVMGTIVAQRTHVWVGGERGLVRFDGARMSVIRSAADSPLTGITGIAETAAGDLWLYTSVGIVTISRAEVERAAADPSYRVRYQTFTFADGVPGLAISAAAMPTIIVATDGRVWFLSSAGLAYIDPAQIKRNTLAPPITIWSIDSGGIQYPAASPPIRLPAHTTNVLINYTAGSLTLPERVRFRYKLEGLDRDWQDGGDRREVGLANLRPGRYDFRVIAANDDGVWNTDGASISFVILPAFYQTKWFYCLCALSCLVPLRFIYMMRIRQISTQVRERLEERLAERERIARDLHDTLLQSVQGLVLRFRAAVARLPRQLEAYGQLEQALDRADLVLTEGRDRVKHLRTPGLDADLPRAIESVGEEMAAQQAVHFRSTVDGTARDLDPIVHEEALFIAREALTNAFRHANAQQIEAEICYDKVELRLRIRDDGKGIDTELLKSGGRDGHWGLLGMRERAGNIRATLTIWSKPGAGTEVDLRIPANLAYRSQRRTRFRWWRRESEGATRR